MGCQPRRQPSPSPLKVCLLSSGAILCGCRLWCRIAFTSAFQGLQEPWKSLLDFTCWGEARWNRNAKASSPRLCCVECYEHSKTVGSPDGSFFLGIWYWEQWDWDSEECTLGNTSPRVLGWAPSICVTFRKLSSLCLSPGLLFQRQKTSQVLCVQHPDADHRVVWS